MKLKHSGLALAIALAVSSGLQAQETGDLLNDLRGSNTQPSSQSAGNAQGNLSESDIRNLVKIYLDEDRKITTDLSPQEKQLIDRKKHLLIRTIYERSQLDPLLEMLKESSEAESFETAKEKEAPLSPGQVKEIRQIINDVRRAENAPLNGPVKMKIRTIELDTDSDKPVTLDVAPGYASSIVFFDQTGAPWPIDGDIIGDVSSFNKKYASESKHIAVFEILREFSESNALVNLKGLPVPVVIRLRGSDEVVDSRLSIRIPKFGPNAEVRPFVSNELENVSSGMLNVMSGERIPGSQSYQLNGVPGDVTFSNNTLYIKTKATLISPPWKGAVTSPTGYNFYEVHPVTNLLFSIDGETREATVEKAFNVDIQHKSSIYQ